MPMFLNVFVLKNSLFLLVPLLSPGREVFVRLGEKFLLDNLSLSREVSRSNKLSPRREVIVCPGEKFLSENLSPLCEVLGSKEVSPKREDS